MKRKWHSAVTGLPHRLREGLEHLPQNFRDWRQELSENPWAIFQATPIRIGSILALVILLILALTRIVGALQPASTGTFSEQATSYATLYVACTNPDCMEHFTVKRPMNFHDWPVKCPECGQETGYRAERCPTCGHWFATRPGQPPTCPFCARRHATEQPSPTDNRPRQTGDNDEDPW